MGRVESDDPAEPGSLLVIFEVDQDLLRDSVRVFGPEQRETATMLEPANQWLVFDPGHDHFSVELVDVFLALAYATEAPSARIGAIESPTDLNAAIVALGGEPLTTGLRKPRPGLVVDHVGCIVGVDPRRKSCADPDHSPAGAAAPSSCSAPDPDSSRWAKPGSSFSSSCSAVRKQGADGHCA